MMLTKSFSPRVSRIVLMVCLAIVSLSPFMLPLTSTTITTSLGDVAACIYLKGHREKEGRYKMHYNLHLTPSMTRLGVMYC